MGKGKVVGIVALSIGGVLVLGIGGIAIFNVIQNSNPGKVSEKEWSGSFDYVFNNQVRKYIIRYSVIESGAEKKGASEIVRCELNKEFVNSEVCYYYQDNNEKNHVYDSANRVWKDYQQDMPSRSLCHLARLNSVNDMSNFEYKKDGDNGFYTSKLKMSVEEESYNITLSFSHPNSDVRLCDATFLDDNQNGYKIDFSDVETCTIENFPEIPSY